MAQNEMKVPDLVSTFIYRALRGVNHEKVTWFPKLIALTKVLLHDLSMQNRYKRKPSTIWATLSIR
jgi:hypothetical protein